MNTQQTGTAEHTSHDKVASVESVLKYASFEVADYSAVWPDMPEGSYTKKEEKGE